MSKRFKLKVFFSGLAISMLTVTLATAFWQAGQPFLQSARVGQALALPFHYPQSLLTQMKVDIQDKQGVLQWDKECSEVAAIHLNSTTGPTCVQPGQVSLKLRLFGLIPVKQIDVSVMPEISLYPGGQPIGIVLRTDGIMVVGMSPVIDEEGKSCFPAEKAGVKIGDIIKEVDGVTVINDEKMSSMVNALGKQNKAIRLTILRDNQLITKEVRAVYCCESHTYRIGLYVRDNAGGVGTLSFIDPDTGRYGALGHMIANNETQERLSIINGKLVRADIESIKKGQKGYPGEKVGSFVSDAALGSIEKNSYAGIFGTIIDSSITRHNYYTKPLPVAYYPEIEQGEAEILTALDGQDVQPYTIRIEKIMPGADDGKGLILKVTDPILLERTGGIIQGMSGSPIIQNGKIIGAVTHVFINDPTKGYGILIDDMLKEAGLLSEQAAKLSA